MIASFNGFYIDFIKFEDSESINLLMVANANRFKRYFPGTLAQNRTKELSEIFAKTKITQSQNKEEYLFTIKEYASDYVIGLVYIKELDWIKKRGEFAYCMDADHGGKGIVSKSVKALSEFAFENLGLETLQIIVHKDNLPSVKVAFNNNFKWIETLLNEFTPTGERPLDMELYELYKDR